MFLDVLKKSAIDYCGLKPEAPLVLGVSGGADSLALLHGLNVLGFNLRIAHLDHALRPESAQDADFVQNLAESYGLPFTRQRVDVYKTVEVEKQSLEEAARHVRYEFLFKQAREYGAQAVVAGHHADDQVETVLMHFLRGSALSGLSGMDYRRVLPIWDNIIPLVRPLLGIWREEIITYLSSVGLEPRIDSSNEDTTYFRNKLRHDLIPALENYNPQFKQVLWRMANVLQEEDRYLNRLVENAWEVCLLRQEDEWIELQLAKFVKFPKVMQRRIIRYAISLIRPDLRDVGYEAVERALAFAGDPSESGKIDLVARVNLAVIKDIVIVKTWDADLPEWEKPLLPSVGYFSDLIIGESLGLRHGWRMMATLYSSATEIIRNKIILGSVNEAWLDYDRLMLPLTVRGREPGVRWQPLGMGGHTQKLKDFFINEKVPEHLRDIWPLVFSEKKIVWVVGLRPSEEYKVTEETNNILHLYLKKTDV